ncbi:hypothetical protein BU15DRAFT_90782 [Melanogaster broomeanus]|nr:hypothetical protein BU15DRAFT_90782 [Melanogaster broomeanus]
MSHIRGNHNPTTSVFNKPVKNETLTKVDKSPVTVADYSTQAVVNMIHRHAIPADPIIGKEDACELCQASGETLRDLELANDALTAELGIGEEWTPVELMDAIDRSSDQGGRVGRRWTLAPIDGTMGLLRGGQYPVCLALIVHGEVVLRIIGCPNLPVNNAEPHGPKGCIFVAFTHVHSQTTLSRANPTTLTIPSVALGTLNLVGSVEAAYSNLAFNNSVSEILNIMRAATQMDSQAKYCCLARGDGGVYLRMLTRAGYKEKYGFFAFSTLKDHAPGLVLPLDFGLGRNLGENYGVIAAGRDVRAQVLAAVQKAQAEEKEEHKLDHCELRRSARLDVPI